MISVTKILSIGFILILSSNGHCETSNNNIIKKIDHVVIIYLENHSFYNLFANFPGADNAFSPDYKGQIAEDGTIYKVLPRVTDIKTKAIDIRFPDGLKNMPFDIDQYAKPNELISDINHEFYSHQFEIHGGKMDRFVQKSGVGALAMGYYNMQNSTLWDLAKKYTLADHFFQSSIGGSFINHQWLIAARMPRFPNAPESIVASLNPDGSLKKFGLISPDGYTVNTNQPLYPPYDPAFLNEKERLPPIEYKNIGDLLSEKNISWTWYSGGWNKILKGEEVKDFQYHHQPFIFFKNYGPNTIGRKEHLKDEVDLLSDISKNTLPHVAFFKPIGSENAHPGYSKISSADAKVKEIVDLINKTPAFKKTLIIITFDEHGGFWDPKAPPVIDRFGPGSRIPAIFVSPFVKKGFIDHTQYETVSILSFLEKKFGLMTLTDRDKNANPLTEIFVHENKKL